MSGVSFELCVVDATGSEMWFDFPNDCTCGSVLQQACEAFGYVSSEFKLLVGGRVIAEGKTDSRMLDTALARNGWEQGTEIVLQAQRFKKEIQQLRMHQVSYGALDLDARSDVVVMRVAVANDPSALRAVLSSGLLDEHDPARYAIVLAGVKGHGSNLQFAGELRDSVDVATAAVKSIGFAFRFASDRLKDDDDFVSFAAKSCPPSFCGASERLRNDRNLALQVAGWGLKEYCFGPKLQRDLSFAAQLIAAHPRFLTTMPLDSFAVGGLTKLFISAVKSDPRLVKVACSHRLYTPGMGSALLSANRCALLCMPPHLVLEQHASCVVAQDGLFLQYCGKHVKSKKLVLKAVQRDGNALRYAPKKLRKDPEVVDAAGRQNPAALQYSALL